MNSYVKTALICLAVIAIYKRIPAVVAIVEGA
jgi:hypothetical protein